MDVALLKDASQIKGDLSQRRGWRDFLNLYRCDSARSWRALFNIWGNVIFGIQPYCVL